MRWPPSVALVLFVGFGCAQRPFEESVRQGYALDVPTADPRLLGVQFFTSERIVLRRQRTTKRDDVAAGRLVHRDRRVVEELVIPAGTPGVGVSADEHSITVAFSRDAKLRFARRQSSGSESEDTSGFYYLDHVTEADGTRTIEVDGHTYHLDRRGSRARLMFAEWTLRRLQKRRRILPGRRVHAAR